MIEAEDNRRCSEIGDDRDTRSRSRSREPAEVGLRSSSAAVPMSGVIIREAALLCMQLSIDVRVSVTLTATARPPAVRERGSPINHREA